METQNLEEALDYLNKHATHGWKRIEGFVVSPKLFKEIKHLCKEDDQIKRYRGYKIVIDHISIHDYEVRIEKFTP
jgi:hypothetical protein